MTAPSPSDRLATEIDLLHAMYPNQITHNPITHDFHFRSATSTLHLRLPSTYPVSGSPDIISACNGSKRDIRDLMKREISDLSLDEGEEALDAIILAFQNLIESTNDTNTASTVPTTTKPQPQLDPSKTVVIWLHHLLNTHKRKLALAPEDPGISGITKPGYPGIMVFSGPRDAVDEHVRVLKAERWQGFQVRLEVLERWGFGGEGVREVESLGDVVGKVVEGGGGLERKEVFLRAVGVV